MKTSPATDSKSVPKPAPTTFERRPWYVPDERRATEGIVEGCPSEAMRKEQLARIALERKHWQPTREAWDQLLLVQRYLGCRVRVQFWNPVMYMLNEDDWPHPVEAVCAGVATFVADGVPQAYLVLQGPTEVKTGGMSGLGYLVERGEVREQLAPLAEIYQIEAIPKES